MVVCEPRTFGADTNNRRRSSSDSNTYKFGRDANIRRKSSLDSKILDTNLNKLGSRDLLKPKIVSLLQQSNIKRDGTELRVSCLLTGYPCQQIKWYHNGERLLPTIDGRVRFEGTRELVIREFTVEDCGNIMVHVSNKYGDAYSSLSVKLDECSSPTTRGRSKTFGGHHTGGPSTNHIRRSHIKTALVSLFGRKGNR